MPAPSWRGGGRDTPGRDGLGPEGPELDEGAEPVLDVAGADDPVVLDAEVVHAVERLTSAGREAVQSWFHGFALAEPKDDQMRSAVTLTIFFGHYLDPALLTRVVREHRLRLERRLDTLRRIEHALDQDQSLPGSTLQ